MSFGGDARGVTKNNCKAVIKSDPCATVPTPGTPSNACYRLQIPQLVQYSWQSVCVIFLDWFCSFQVEKCPVHHPLPPVGGALARSCRCEVCDGVRGKESGTYMRDRCLRLASSFGTAVRTLPSRYLQLQNTCNTIQCNTQRNTFYIYTAFKCNGFCMCVSVPVCEWVCECQSCQLDSFQTHRYQCLITRNFPTVWIISLLFFCNVSVRCQA